MNEEKKNELNELADHAEKLVDNAVSEDQTDTKKEPVQDADPEKEVKRIVDEAAQETHRVLESAKRLYDQAGQDEDEKEVKSIMNQYLEELKKILNTSTEKVKTFLKDPKVVETRDKAVDALNASYSKASDYVNKYLSSLKENPDVQHTVDTVSKKLNEGTAKLKETARTGYDEAMKDENVAKAVNAVKTGYDKVMATDAAQDFVKNVRKGFGIMADTFAQLAKEADHNKKDDQ